MFAENPMSAIENYWYAVKDRIDKLPELCDADGEVDNGVPRLPRGGGTADDGSRSNSKGAPGLRLLWGQANFYRYQSIRFRRGKHDWGVYVMTGGRDLIADMFAPFCATNADATEAATDFLMTCGTAHYQFDVYAMSAEAMLCKALYLPYQKATQSAVPQLETALVCRVAREWAVPKGLLEPVARILERWTTDHAFHTLPARHLGAYMATALIEGFGALPGRARFDQSEWAQTIPKELARDCPGPHLIKRKLRESSVQQRDANNLSPLDWLKKWGVTAFSEIGDEFVINQDLVIFGDIFPRGEFPVTIARVEGDFVCQETNLAIAQGLPREIAGTVDIARNRMLHSLKGIHQTTRIDGGRMRISDRHVKENVLGLFKIAKLAKLDTEADERSLSENKWVDIVNQHLTGDDDSVAWCQQVLIEAGLKAFAKL
jgi:hypothetical protein